MTDAEHQILVLLEFHVISVSALYVSGNAWDSVCCKFMQHAVLPTKMNTNRTTTTPSDDACWWQHILITRCLPPL